MDKFDGNLVKSDNPSIVYKAHLVKSPGRSDGRMTGFIVEKDDGVRKRVIVFPNGDSQGDGLLSGVMIRQGSSNREYVRGMMAAKSLPYDAEIEYLEFIGGQIIDSSITFSYTTGENTSIDIDVQVTADYNETQIIGCGGILATQWFGNSSGYYACGGGPAQRLPILSSARANLHFSVSRSGNNFTCTISSGGTSVSFTRTSSSGWHDVTIGGEPGFYAKMKVWSARIYSGANLVRNFVPVRVGQVGYMYDRVSGQLFGNLGTGNFILGPDIQ